MKAPISNLESPALRAIRDGQMRGALLRGAYPLGSATVPVAPRGVPPRGPLTPPMFGRYGGGLVIMEKGRIVKPYFRPGLCDLDIAIRRHLREHRHHLGYTSH